MRIPSGKTDQNIYFVAVDATDLKTRKTGLSSFTVYRSRNNGAATAYTTPTVTEVSAANMPGVYGLLLDEDTTIAAGSDSEEYCVHITASTMAPVSRTIELYRRDTTSGQTITVANGAADADVERVQGTVIATPTVAGVFKTDVTHFGGTAGTFTSGRPEVNASHISGAAVSTSSAQLGVNVVNAGGTAWGAGAITAASIATNAIDADALATDAVTEIQSGLSTLTQANIRSAVGLASANLDTQLDAIPTASETADATKTALGITTGTADSGTTTTMVDAALTQADTDYWKGSWIVFTSGTISGQTRLITGFTPASDTVTFAPATTQAVGTNTYIIIPNGRVDVELWDGSAVNALTSGRVDVTVGALQTDVITSTAIAGSAVSEIQSGLSTLDATGVRSAVGLASANLDTQLGALPTAAENADAVWDEPAGGHTTAGTYGQALNIIRANTAQAGTSTTITLDASASATDDFYKNTFVFITGGTGAGQARIISGYVGSTKVATVSAWTVNPSSDSVFVILPFGAIPGATAPTAAEVADAVWDEATSGHTTAGTTGKALTDAGSAGDPWSTALPGSYGAGSAGKLIGDNLNATISSRASQVSLDTLDDYVDTEVAAIKAKTDNLPVDPADASDIAASFAALPSAATIAAAVWDRDATGHQTQGTFGQAIGDPGADTDTIFGLLNTNLDTTVSSRLASASISLSGGSVTVGTNNDKTGYTASTVTDKTGYALSSAGVQAIWDALTSALTTVGSIGKKLTDWALGTDNRVLVSANAHTSGETIAGNAGNIAGSVGSVATGGISSGSLAASAQNAIADAVLDRNMAAGTDSGTNSTAVRTPRQALRALRNKVTVSAGTATITKEDDVATSWTASVATTAGNPTSGVDPT